MTDQKDIKTLQAEGQGPAPCARFCEATAFNIEIAGLQRRCGHYINQWSEVCNDNLVLINERNAYAAAADTMAAAHKVERDALKDAARLALDVMDDLSGVGMSEAECLSVLRAIAALMAVL